MRTQHPGVTWEKQDIRSLTLPENSLDVCIDKATLDAMLYGGCAPPLPFFHKHLPFPT